MKKTYIALQSVIDFMDKQPETCRAEYIAIVDRLEADGFLIEPYAKKIETNLFEIRIRKGQHVRVFYCYDDGDYVIGIHAFVKKTQKTPNKELAHARKIIRAIMKRGQ